MSAVDDDSEAQRAFSSGRAKPSASPLDLLGAGGMGKKLVQMLMQRGEEQLSDEDGPMLGDADAEENADYAPSESATGRQMRSRVADGDVDDAVAADDEEVSHTSPKNDAILEQLMQKLMAKQKK